jgi:hypothetical protein
VENLEEKKILDGFIGMLLSLKARTGATSNAENYAVTLSDLSG